MHAMQSRGHKAKTQQPNIAGKTHVHIKNPGTHVRRTNGHRKQETHSFYQIRRSC